jgi:hypothetical protein
MIPAFRCPKEGPPFRTMMGWFPKKKKKKKKKRRGLTNLIGSKKRGVGRTENQSCFVGVERDRDREREGRRETVEEKLVNGFEHSV